MGLYKFTTQGTEFDLFQGINDIISLCLKHQLFIIFPVLSRGQLTAKPQWVKNKPMVFN